MSSRLAKLAQRVSAETGMRMEAAPLHRLAAAVERLTGGGDREAPEEAAGRLGLIQELIDAVTVQESFFLRQGEQLHALDWHALLAAAQEAGRDEVRVWSAACARGEETYSLALLASEAFGCERPQVSVLGTDISTSALAQARAGRYGRRAVQALAPDLLERHFDREGDELVVNDRLRALVRFERHNLVGDAAPPSGEAPFDLIVCRNVLIYLEPYAVERVAASLSGALASGGTLLLGTADRLCLAQRSLPAVRPRRRPAGRRKAARGSSKRGAGARRPRRGSGRAGASPSRPPRPEPPPRHEEADASLADALRLANAGMLEEAAEVAERALGRDPMNAPAHFVRGTAQLALGDAEEAVRCFRAGLYVDPRFALAAFQLGRAYDLLGREREARQAYRRALSTFDPDDTRHLWMLEDVDIADAAAACRARLRD